MRTAFILIATFVLLLVAACSGEDETTSPEVEDAAASVAVPPAPPTITNSQLAITDASGSVGQVVKARVLLSDAKTGIAGYVIIVSVADPVLARITNVTLPDFGLTAVGELPAGSVEITAADLPGLLEGEIKEARLATLDIELLRKGTTDLLLEIRIMDDDDGNVMIPDLIQGKILVN